MSAAATDVVLIEPSRVRRWLGPLLLPLLLGCLVFGVLMLWQRGRFELHDCLLLGCFLGGVLLLAVYSVLAVRATWQLPHVTMLLSPAGFTLYVPPGPATIPWSDFEVIGLVRDDWIGQTAGLRLKSYHGFHASLEAEGHGMPRPPLAELREARGYEVQVPRLALAGSALEFLDLLEEYLGRYGG